MKRCLFGSGIAIVRVGHHTLTGRPTGCTGIVVEKGAILRAVREATGLPSYPAVGDLTRK